jgi:hypothetical protein
MSTGTEVVRSTAVTSRAVTTPLTAPIRILPVPWRDPHTVSKEELAVHISSLEAACQDNPKSPDLRTMLGMAYAMNYEAYKSMDALEAAVKLGETHFFAQLKLSELFYRLRALPRSEEETLKGRQASPEQLGASFGPQATSGDPPADSGRDAKTDVEQIP